MGLGKQEILVDARIHAERHFPASRMLGFYNQNYLRGEKATEYQ
jgi:hypothetical protein